MNETVVEYREAIDARLSSDAPYKIGHRIVAVDGECEWNADLFDVQVKGGVLLVYTRPLYEARAGEDECVLTAAYGPSVWGNYKRVDYAK